MERLTFRLAAAFALGAIAVIATATLSAHHSFAMYDQSIKYVFTGVVERINPDAAHLQVSFVPLNEKRDALVRLPDGTPATWLVEMGGAAASARDGISVNDFPRGTLFSVGLVPLRSGQRAGARVEGLFQCPKGKTPAPGLHCDSVEGAIAHGNGKLVKATAVWKP